MSTPVDQWVPGMAITAGRLQYMLERLAESLSVTAYGANGTGTTDDAPGIQAALNAARDAGGGWVIVPPGTYLLTTLPLRIYRNTRLTLLPGAVFKRGATGTILVNGDSGQTLGGYTGHGNIIVEGGVWNMQGTAAGLTASAMCISIGHAADVTIRDLEIRDVPGYHAVELNSTKRGIVQNCRFIGYVDPGSRDFSEAVQVDLAKGAEYFGPFGPYDHTPCEDILVTGCYFGPSGTAGTTSWPRGVGSHSATIGKWHRRVRVAECTFEGVLQYAVSAYNWENVSVTGCSFTSCGSGVRFRSVILTDPEDTKDANGTQTNASQSMRNLAVTGCVFRSGGGYDEPIIALGETSGQVLNVTVSGNAIDGSTNNENGVRLQRVSRAAIDGNTICNVSGTGVSTEDVSNVTIAGNVIWTPGARGITLIASDNCSVIGNQIRDSANEGILLQTSTDVQVRDNAVKGASTASNGGYSGIRLSDGQDSIAISGNKVRPNSSNANKMSYGLSIGTGTNMSRWGNDCRALGGTYVNGSINDSSTSPSTVATDLS